MAKLLLASSLVLAYSYADEAFLALLGDPYARASYLGRATGEFAAIYWGAILCAVGSAQLLWLRAVREGFWAPLAIAIVVNVGIWLDRFAIVVAGLYRDYLPSIWRLYAPTFAEWMLLIGTVGLFCVLLLLFVRFLPVITMFEARHAEHEEAE